LKIRVDEFLECAPGDAGIVAIGEILREESGAGGLLLTVQNMGVALE
jgi:hypothetical protein